MGACFERPSASSKSKKSPSWTPLASKKRISNCKFATHSLDSPFSMNKKHFLARPPLASTPFKKRNTPMFAAHSPLTRLRLVKSLQNGSKLLCYGTVSPSYFFLFLIGQPILFFLFFLIFSYFVLIFDRPTHLIFSYFFFFSLIFPYFFLFFLQFFKHEKK